jgi:Cys-tRNA(Pro)/Cys-tRNA(Cys) deacylase
MANAGKTNARRILDRAGVAYKQYEYAHDEGFVDGVTVAGRIGQPAGKVFKTLVTQGASRAYHVFVLPVAEELDLKAAARACGEKSVEMIKVADIEKITGYIRGGCSPVGMKKEYQTVIDKSCEGLETVIVSAGRLGCQMELAVKDLIDVTHCGVGNISVQR